MKSNSDPVLGRAPRGGSERIIAGGAFLFVVLVLAFFFDAQVDQWVAATRIAELERVAKLCSRYLAWHWLMLVGCIALIAAWLSSRRDLLRLVCLMMIAASVAGLSADIIRGITGRTRPYAQVPQGFYGVHDGARWLITKHAYNSFPSGHTTAICGFAVPLLLWRRRLIALVVPLVAMVAAARVYLGAHHISDVVAGAMLGAFVAHWVFRRGEKWALAPSTSAAANE